MPQREPKGRRGAGEETGPRLVWEGKREISLADLQARALPLRPDERWGDSPNGTLVRGDNLVAMASLLAKNRGKLKLVYIDPPYAVGSDFRAPVEVGEDAGKVDVAAYDDTWAGLGEYLSMMHERLVLVRELLAVDGHLYVHCDRRVNSHLRLLLDEVFGPEAYRNEVVWTYGGKGLTNARGNYVRNWGSILYYAMPAAVLDLRSGRVSESVIERWGRYMDPAGRILFGTLRQSGETLELAKAEKTFRRREGREPEDGDVARDYGAGALLKDVWDDLPIVRENNAYTEFLGYRTQKPEALLERIVLASSSPGDTVADFFCGTGTTCAVAQRLGRRWIGVDSSDLAVHIARKRLSSAGAKFDVVRQGEDEPGGRLAAELVKREGGWAARLVSYRPRLPEGVSLAAPLQTLAEAGGLDFVDWWAVGTGGDGSAPFRPVWHASRGRQVRKLAVESPVLVHGVDARVKVVDVFGRETVVEL